MNHTLLFSASALSQFSDSAITILTPAVTAILLYLVHRVVKIFETKTKITLDQHEEDMIDGWVNDAIHFAEEKAHKAATNKLATVTGPEKLEAAADYVISSVRRAGWGPMARDKIKAAVEAKLNTTRNGVNK